MASVDPVVSLVDQQQQWDAIQDEMSTRLIKEDKIKPIRYIGGVDISFSAADPTAACTVLVVLDAETMQIVYEGVELVQVTVPYISGYLAFGEAPHYVKLINQLKARKPLLVPQVILVNGVLHPKRFGLACHLGVEVDIPTIVVSKKPTKIDGINDEQIQELIPSLRRAYLRLW